MVGNIGGLFVWLFRLAFMGAIFASGGLLFGSFRNCSPLSTWEKVPLISSKLSECDHSGAYGVCAEYSYQIRGKLFYGDRLSCVDEGYSEASQASARLQQIKSEIHYAWVRSDKNSVSVIERSIPYGLYFMLAFAVVLWWLFERWVNPWIRSRLTVFPSP